MTEHCVPVHVFSISIARHNALTTKSRMINYVNRCTVPYQLINQVGICTCVCVSFFPGVCFFVLCWFFSSL